jgi:uncharacterized cupredoxin-like copper-binding protein
MRFQKVAPTITLFVVMLCLLMPGSILADDFKEEPVTVSLVDSLDSSGNPFAVNASVGAVEHRKVTFNVTNNSLRPIAHELIVIKTDLPAGELPLGVDGRVDESQVEIVGRTPVLTAGALSATFTDVLKKGNYVLICNVGTHYTRGMRTGFQVVKDQKE